MGSAEHVSDANADLFFACVKGELADVERALAQGAEHSRPEAMSGIPPLSWAARSGHVDCALSLIKAGANPWARADGPSEIKSAIGCAMQFKHYGILQALVEHGGKPSLHQRSYEFDKALRSEKMQAVEIFIKAGACVDELWDMGEASPLSIAVSTKNEDSVRLILSHGALVDRLLGEPSSHSSAALKAVEGGWLAGLKILLEAGASPEGPRGRGSLALCAIGRHGKGAPGVNAQMLAMLHGFGGELCSREVGPQLLSMAALAGDEASVRWLCGQGVDPEWTPSLSLVPSAAIQSRMNPQKACCAFILRHMAAMSERREIGKVVENSEPARAVPRI